MIKKAVDINRFYVYRFLEKGYIIQSCSLGIFSGEIISGEFGKLAKFCKAVYEIHNCYVAGEKAIIEEPEAAGPI
ncbi:MAG: hypothetical protein ABI416_10190 [Ginsengibacter sp.]